MSDYSRAFADLEKTREQLRAEYRELTTGLIKGEVSKFDSKYDNYLANGIEFFKDLKYTIKACGDKKFKEIFDRHDKKSQEAFENMWKERRRNK